MGRSRHDSIELLKSDEYRGDITRLLAEEEEEEESDSRKSKATPRMPSNVAGRGNQDAASNSQLTHTGTGSNKPMMAHTSRSNRTATLSTAEADGLLNSQEELTDKAVTVVQRVLDKLNGLDFQEQNKKNGSALEISEQIDLLIEQATSNDNLSTCFIGWCAFW